jgi:hypothetical protein
MRINRNIYDFMRFSWTVDIKAIEAVKICFLAVFFLQIMRVSAGQRYSAHDRKNAICV